MDYLPVQASSVPCEHVFSSAGLTDTKRRNRIAPMLMEALQILKFIYKKERLNFTAGFMPPPEHEVSHKLPSSTDSSTNLLAKLFTEDAVDTTDTLLRIFGADDSDDEVSEVSDGR
jgi:hypothetical protein